MAKKIKKDTLTDVFREEDERSVAGESEKVQSPNDISTYNQSQIENRKARLSLLMSQMAVANEMMRAAQNTLILIFAEVNSDRLYLELPGCSTMEQFVHEYTPYEYWKVEKYLQVAQKLLTTEINKKILAGKPEQALIRLVDGMKEENALFEKGEVRFPDGRVVSLSDYESSLASKNNKEVSKLLNISNNEIKSLKGRIADKEKEAETYRQEMQDLQKIVDDQTHQTGISPEVRKVFRERKELGNVISHANGLIQSGADILLAAGNPTNAGLKNFRVTEEHGQQVAILLTSLAGIYREIYSNWESTLPVELKELP